MSNSDKRISALVVVVILIHITTFTIVLTTPAFSFLIALINLIASSSILIYWIQKQIRISQHFIELREISVLCFEVVAIGCAIYSLTTDLQIQLLIVANFTILGIHLVASLIFFIFMLTFKMKKLF